MTHEWVEQKNKEYVEQFKNYPQELIDAWYEIPKEYRNFILGAEECERVIRLLKAQIKLGEPVCYKDIFRLVYETEEAQIKWRINIDLEKEDVEKYGDDICESFEKFYKMAYAYHNFLGYGDPELTPYSEAEDKVMEFDGDIIITDPCYLRRRDINNFDDFDLGKQGIHGISSQTFYGDWSCHTFDMINADENGNPKILGEFCADGGMVCVADLNSVLKYNAAFDYYIEKPWTTTLIKNFKGTVTIKIDQEPDDQWPSYTVHVVGKGINKETGEPISFDTRQTGL